MHHQLLNETLPNFNTTAENLALWLWDTFEHHLPEGNHVYRL
ncbi:6-carboxytetrahydropterin synthase [Staphylococcus auricularis]|nr:6-carboxytetrahydropterin synthase [Staphylococcus auricularis]